MYKTYEFKIQIEGMNGHVTYKVIAKSEQEAVDKAYDDAQNLPKYVFQSNNSNQK
tara:strand:+ start:77 stop:241 length:165 start_codon:yes stop_codon:yes gene_type:complete